MKNWEKQLLIDLQVPVTKENLEIAKKSIIYQGRALNVALKELFKAVLDSLGINKLINKL